MFTDTHTHLSGFSGDGRQTVDELLIAARDSQLAGICVTDHYDKDVFYTPAKEEIFSVDDYFLLLDPIRHRQAQLQPRFYIGIELGFMPHLCSHFSDLTRRYAFDSVILSMHLLDGVDPYVMHEIYLDGKEKLYGRYLRRLAEMIGQCPDHDIVGHFDYISRYAPYTDRKMRYQETPKAFNLFFRTLIKEQKALEINAGTVAKLLAEGYQGFDAWPDPAIMLAYHKLGGRLVSLGSDAHTSADIARYFAKTTAWLKELGFEHVVHYERRRPMLTAIQ